MDYEILLRQFGYGALLLGTMLEGETFLFMAGLAAYNGLLSMHYVLPLAYLGTVVGDQVPFFIGRLKGRAFLEKRPRWRKRTEKVLRKLNRHRLKILFFYRFMYGFRGVTPFVFGLTHMRAKYFILVNAVVGLAWTLAVGGAGYYLGHFLTQWGVAFKEVQIAIAAVLLPALTGYWLIRRKINHDD